MTFLQLVGNIVWILLGGLISALEYLLAGLLLCITIVGIPFGLQCFKIATVILMPFGASIERDPNAVVPLNCLMNLLWLIPGILISITHLVAGIGCFLTIIGIPFGLMHFKLIKIAISPFGRIITRE
jgi:uncharacterized membrane protein YccF (DUF307 family)